MGVCRGCPTRQISGRSGWFLGPTSLRPTRQTQGRARAAEGRHCFYLCCVLCVFFIYIYCFFVVQLCIYIYIYIVFCVFRARAAIGCPWLATGSYSVRMKGTASRKLLKHLPGPPGSIFAPKTIKKHVKITTIGICVLRKLHFLCIGSH